MTQLQKTVIDEYMGLLDGPPLRVVSKNTGINHSRLHRLFNGSEMKLQEYEVFQNEIKKIKNVSSSFEELMNSCIFSLSKKKIKEIEMDIRRNLLISSIVR